MLRYLIFLFPLLIGASLSAQETGSWSRNWDSLFVHYTADPASDDIRMFWKNDTGAVIGDLWALDKEVRSKGERLVFAMNGGMYLKDQSPQGLYIEKGKKVKGANRVQKAYGNFYLQPNGVFYLCDSTAGVVVTQHVDTVPGIVYATQSGPMFLIDGSYHPALMKGSQNKFVRTGVGILPDGRVIFAMSKGLTNFYDMATFFKEHGCENALYLDGNVSRVFWPDEGWTFQKGFFGVMIGVVE